MNPYKTPKSKIEDLNYQDLPKALIPLYWLIGLAAACSFLSMTISVMFILQDLSTELYWFDWEGQLIFLIMIASMYALVFMFYYFLIFRPLQQRKHSTSQWWLASIAIMLILWGGIYLLPIEETTETSWLENSLSILELGCLMLAAFLARRPAALQHLIN
ncbi:MAG: hypothetical protein RLZZ215_389 [Pseudomonadota bacterium]|jgi:hypothetical protein